MNINERLAKAKNQPYVKDEKGNLCYDIFKYDGDWESWKEFDYKDPAISMECLEWLLDNGFRLECNLAGEYIARSMLDLCSYSEVFIDSRSLPEAIALAYIEAKENKEGK